MKINMKNGEHWQNKTQTFLRYKMNKTNEVHQVILKIKVTKDPSNIEHWRNLLDWQNMTSMDYKGKI